MEIGETLPIVEMQETRLLRPRHFAPPSSSSGANQLAVDKGAIGVKGDSTIGLAEIGVALTVCLTTNWAK